MEHHLHKHTLHLPKIPYSDIRGINAVEVEGKLEIRFSRQTRDVFNRLLLSNTPMLTISVVGRIWDTRHRDWAVGGQCQDTLREYLPLHHKLWNFWDQWHLNGMCAANFVQSHYADKHKLSYKYPEILELLGNFSTFKGYTYGKAWLYKPVTKAALDTYFGYFPADDSTKELAYKLTVNRFTEFYRPQLTEEDFIRITKLPNRF